MHIPDKYRDRYDRLARSHPWMREMRDEREPSRSEKRAAALDRLNTSGDRDYYRGLIHDLIGEPPADCTHEKVMERLEELLTDEPTNGIDGETNGIADDSPLVNGLPEGDAVSILRRAADSDTPMVSLCNRFDAAPLLPSEHSRVFGQLADMVERDYVYRPIHDATDSERRELLGRCLELTDERDELKAEVDDWRELNAQVIDDWRELHAQVMSERNHALAERDEWKAKAEGSSKVRVGQSKSAKRAAAVERLRNCRDFYLSTMMCAMTGFDSGPHAGEQWRDALLDLLTDEDANDDLPPDSDVSSNDVEANDGRATPGIRKGLGYRDRPPHEATEATKRFAAELDAELDSREKLEAEVSNFGFIMNLEGYQLDLIHGWLDRQAAITEREHPGLTVSDDESLINWHGRNYLPQSMVLNAERERNEFSLKLKHEMELNAHNRNAHDLERIQELEHERDELREKLEDDWKYASLKKSVDLLKAKVRTLTAENTQLHAQCYGMDGLTATARIGKLAAKLGECMAERDELQGAYDEITRIAAELCRACGFSMVDASGEVIG